MAGEDEEFGEKTFEPTEHRRRQARESGNVVRSVELTTAVHLLATAIILYALGAGLVEALGQLIARHVTTAADGSSSPSTYIAQFRDLSLWSGRHVLPWLAALVVTAIAVNLAQVGFLVTTERLGFNFEHLNPVTGLKRIFGSRSIATMLLSIAKLSVLLGVALWFINGHLPLFLALSTESAGTSFRVIGQTAVELSLWLAAVLIVIGASDFGYQKWKYERELMMSRYEYELDMKNQDGDPKIRQRRKEAHLKLIKSRNIRKTADADFVLVNPTHYSLAFKYAPPRYPVPTLLVKGVDEVALRMREVAKEHDIPIIERPELARQLYAQLQPGQGIPADLYDVFIAILKYVYSITGKTVEMPHRG